MVIVEYGLKSEGLLERGYDWYVQQVKLERGALATTEFNGVFSSWKQKVQAHTPAKLNPAPLTKDPQEMTVGELTGNIKPAQLWSVLASLAALVAGAFVLGTRLAGK